MQSRDLITGNEREDEEQREEMHRENVRGSDRGAALLPSGSEEHPSQDDVFY